MDHFGSRLEHAIAATQTVLCVGLDPHPALMPDLFGGPADTLAAAGVKNVRSFCEAVLDAASGRVPAIKPQIAFFEAMGPEGMELLIDISARARAAGLLVIMDAKRGDIGSTATAYAQAWLGPDSVFGGDALTVNPYLGLDSLQPFIDQAVATQSGLFVLVRTSNAGSADIQQRSSQDKPIWHHVADFLAHPTQLNTPSSSMLSSIGIVAGATGPDEAKQLRAYLPSAPFLIPGYGAQGASAAEACAGLFTSTSGQLTGGLVNASRGITHSKEARSASNLADYTDILIRNIEHAKAELALR